MTLMKKIIVGGKRQPSGAGYRKKMKTLNVTAAVIERGQEILIAQRLKGSHMGLKWEFPGGKIEPGESPEECLRREIKEELDLDIQVGDKLMAIEHQYDELKVFLHCYRCIYLGGEAKRKDCQDFRWVLTGDLKSYPFADADLPVVNFLMVNKGPA